MELVCKIFLLPLLLELSLCSEIAIVDDYKLNVTSSGPAVYGSVMKFQAQLYLGTSQTPQDKKLFRYDWRSTVDMLTETQHADYNTSYHRCFDSLVKPRQYKMQVTVYDQNSKAIFKPVVKKDLDFDITSMLNGNLKNNQTVHRRLKAPKNTFSTEMPIRFLANLTDNFTHSPNFTYKWYINNKLFEAGNNETELINIQETGYHTVRLDVVASGFTIDCKGFEYQNNLKGSFQADVIMKDPVLELQLLGKKVVNKGESITLHADYNGSAPFNFCWNLTPYDKRHEGVNGSCRNVISNTFTISVPQKNLSKAGRYKLNIRIENDISVLNQQHTLTVTQEHHSSHSAAIVLVPVVSVLVFITVLLYGAVQYSKHRRKTLNHIEHADFDFHKNIQNTSSEGWFWSNLKDIFRSLLHSHDSERSWQRINSTDRFDTAPVGNGRRYGTMVSPVEA